ncbi:MAG: SMC-Scp complex subunit ScpB [Oligoflexia bacterium]|nr:SMC-Scp complex subunit ScpB [Oligoflexia bacterium]
MEQGNQENQAENVEVPVGVEVGEPSQAEAQAAAVESERLAASAKEMCAEERAALMESMLFAHGEPISMELFAAVTKLEESELREALAVLKVQLEQGNRGIELSDVGGKYQLRTRLEHAAFIRELKSGKPRRLSNAALETLAVVAYRQPIVRSDIEKIRGVDVTPTLKTLLERRLVRIVGHQESVGQPALYGTTDDFLKIFGLSSLSQLPTLRDLKEFDRDPGEPGEEDLDAKEDQRSFEPASQNVQPEAAEPAPASEA